MAAKYIFVTGGVVSSLGKGITAASLGRILKSRGYKVAIQKFDPYINVDAGMMSPLQHGEVYVTRDGGECDLDVGHYERFIDESLTFDNNVSTGRIYWSIITREQQGGFDGGTVQVIPHITGEIKRRALLAGKSGEADIVITEIGGTVGDIESLPHLEAIRQIKTEVGSENCLFIHVTLVPYLSATNELKTKPTQHSVKELLSLGIQPNIIVCRTEHELDEEIREKIALFCNVEARHVVQNLDAETLYEIPMMLEQEGLDDLVCEQLGLERRNADLDEWREMVRLHKTPQSRVEIALVGKYVQFKDSYISVTEALVHGGIAKQIGVDIRWLDAEKLDNYESMCAAMEGVDGIIVPGGFGHRGMRGKMLAAKYAREHNVPFFGIGLGMQMAAVDVAREVLGLEGAHTTEAQSDSRILVTVSGSHHKETKGIFRLGNYRCLIKPGTLASSIYGEEHVDERHRHRYEINPALIGSFEEHGLIVSGRDSEGGEVEIMELNGHNWYVIVSFHPEFRSRPNRPHPLFKAFIEACGKNK